ncbi:MAG: 3-phosphoshikimate 1-carboxyvinyltransferase, partial [Thermodesulfobacteriota bacterium]|nr:3-phosphoshikimate 1-carboxyvinyltransferase [Thermodesulfobacteriota bacterium]
MKEIRPLSSIDATVRIPGSKSITHRAVIASGLASGQSVLKSFLECEDTLYTASVLGELGVDVRIKGEDLEVVGTGGRLISAPTKRDLYLGNSGTSFRLLLSVVALSGGEFLMTGSQRMLERPIGSLVDALNRLGVKATCVEQKDCPPVLVKADGIRGGRVSIPGDQSSQFISSLLLCGPYAKTDIEITVTGELVSKPYVDITIDVMEEFGARVDR